jgi:hypothetical protein
MRAIECSAKGYIDEAADHGLAAAASFSTFAVLIMQKRNFSLNQPQILRSAHTWHEAVLVGLLLRYPAHPEQNGSRISEYSGLRDNPALIGYVA